MKRFAIKYLVLSLIFISCQSNAQKYNTKGGFGAEGYDVVSYFNNEVVKGNSDYQLKFNGVVYRFSTEENAQKFKSNPSKYEPQYGGWCAYAMGTDGSKVSINPKTFEIRDGKLYLFYNQLGTNTLDLWLKENPEKLKKAADNNWDKLKNE